MIWLTIDVEEVTDMNFHIKWKEKPKIDYENYIEYFLNLKKDHKSTAFILGTFAEKYPNIVKRLYDNNVEIACHGYKHNLVYKESFEEWRESVKKAKDLLEEIIQHEVLGYRSPSWSMPFQKKYYEELKKMGFNYSSSYFPMKNYMYGNSIDKSSPFYIYTSYGKIQERPVPKYIIPFSGGFYLRVLPLWLLKILFKRVKNPVLYIHPYELIDKNLLIYFKDSAKFNIDYLLAFYSWGYAKNKIESILNDQ